MEGTLKRQIVADLLGTAIWCDINNVDILHSAERTASRYGLRGRDAETVIDVALSYKAYASALSVIENPTNITRAQFETFCDDYFGRTWYRPKYTDLAHHVSMYQELGRI